MSLAYAEGRYYEQEEGDGLDTSRQAIRVTQPDRLVRVTTPGMRYGFGVIAGNNGYEEARHISEYVADPSEFAQVPHDVFLLRRLDPNSVGAINMRQESAQRVNNILTNLGHLVLGRE